jgi:hypothetical protein
MRSSLKPKLIPINPLIWYSRIYSLLSQLSWDSTWSYIQSLRCPWTRPNRNRLMQNLRSRLWNKALHLLTNVDNLNVTWHRRHSALLRGKPVWSRHSGGFEFRLGWHLRHRTRWFAVTSNLRIVVCSITVNRKDKSSRRTKPLRRRTIVCASRSVGLRAVWNSPGVGTLPSINVGVSSSPSGCRGGVRDRHRGIRLVERHLRTLASASVGRAHIGVWWLPVEMESEMGETKGQMKSKITATVAEEWRVVSDSQALTSTGRSKHMVNALDVSVIDAHKPLWVDHGLATGSGNSI